MKCITGRFVILSTTAFCFLGDAGDEAVNETNLEYDLVHFHADFGCIGMDFVSAFESVAFSSDTTTAHFLRGSSIVSRFFQ